PEPKRVEAGAPKGSAGGFASSSSPSLPPSPGGEHGKPKSALWALHAARLTRRPCHRFQDLLRGFVGAPRAIPGSVAAGPSSDSLNLPRVCAIRADAVRGWMTREGPIAEGRNDAEAEELGDGDPRHGAA